MLLGLFVLSLFLVVCHTEFRHSPSRFNCSCRNDSGKQRFISSLPKEDNNRWVTPMEYTNCSCNSLSALELRNEITATTSTKDKSSRSTTSPSTCVRYSESEMISKGFERHGSSLYKFHTVPQDWESARRTCQSEGAHLAVLNSKQEATILERIFARYPIVENTKDNPYALVGFHDQFTEGNYLTIFGEPIAAAGYAEWADKNPNNGEKRNPEHPGENCGSINRKAKLNDAPCGGRYAFFCELVDGYYPPSSEIDYSAGYYTGVEYVTQPPPGNVKRRKPSSGYMYYPGAGFYKMHTQPDTWENARRICESEDAHLAIINSQYESDIMSHLFAHHTIIYNVLWNDFAFIGFHDQFAEGKFVTIYNEPLESTGFTEWWATGEPNDLGDNIYDVGEDCGAVHRNGGLNDLTCHWKHAFICEQPLLE